MVIRVTQAHINNGSKGFCRLCPVALAFIDAGFEWVSVGREMVQFKNGQRYWLDSNVTAFINAYDFDEKTPKPFSFNFASLTVMR